MQKTKFAKVEVPSLFNSSVDIVIPYHGQYEKVTRLLESLFRLTRSNYYRVYIVDDSSPNASFLETIGRNSAKNSERLKTENILNTLRTEEQLGFAGACKLGYDAGESPYVCFINSDCIIEDANWLRSMGETLLALKNKGVRMVSAMTNNPVDGDPQQKGEKFNRSEEDYILENDSFLTMYCFMCHRQLFSKCGGFLKQYPYGYFEDHEFAHRMKKQGYSQAVCKSSWVYHEGQATIRNIWRSQPNIRKIMEEDNRVRCLDDMKR